MTAGNLTSHLRAQPGEERGGGAIGHDFSCAVSCVASVVRTRRGQPLAWKLRAELQMADLQLQAGHRPV